MMIMTVTMVGVENNCTNSFISSAVCGIVVEFFAEAHCALYNSMKCANVFVRLIKHWYKEQMMQIKWGKHLSEPLHVSNVVRQGEYLVHTC